jgi:hypothetical protein
LPFALRRQLASASQLSPELFILGAKLSQLPFHPRGVGAEFSKLGLDAFQVRPQDFSEGSAHLLGLPGDDLPDLCFHSLGAGHRSCDLTLPLSLAAKRPVSPGFRAFPRLLLIPADVSFAGSSSGFRVVREFTRVAPDLSSSHCSSFAFGAPFGTVLSVKHPGEHQRRAQHKNEHSTRFFHDTSPFDWYSFRASPHTYAACEGPSQ